jgi:hypothetical protein
METVKKLSLLRTFKGLVTLALNFPQSSTWLSLVAHLSNCQAHTQKEAPMTTDATSTHIVSSLFVFLPPFLKFPRERNVAKLEKEK